MIRELLSQRVWAMEETALRAFLEVARANLALAFEDGAPAAPPPYRVAGSVAVIPVAGMILPRKIAALDRWGVAHTGMAEFVQAVEAANQDSAVSSVLLRVSSPGGTIPGVADAALAVRASAKPVEAHAELAASAAYWLVSGARKITGSAHPVVGSVGVYTVLEDWSRLFDREGVRVEVVRSGNAKGVGVFGAPLTPEQLAVVQREIDAHHAAFVQDVLKGRTNLTKETLVADGSVRIGKDALASGLVDALEPLAAVLTRLNSGAGVPRRAVSALVKEPVMDPTNHPPAASPTPPTPAADVPPAPAPAPAPAANPPARPDPNAAGKLTLGEALLFARGLGQNAHDAAVRAAEASRSVDEVKNAAVEAARAVKPVSVSITADAGQKNLRAMELALVAEARPEFLQAMQGPKAKAVARALGFDSPELAERAIDEARGHVGHRRRLIDLAEQCAHATASRSGRSAPRFATQDDVIRAAFSSGNHFEWSGPMAVNYAHGTGDFPQLMGNILNRSLLGRMAMAQTTYEKWCRIGSANDFRDHQLITISQAERLLLVPEGQKPKGATVSERAELIRVLTYARTFSMTRQMIINDDRQAFSDQGAVWGNAAAQTPEILATALLEANAEMADGVALFHANHKNIFTAAALSQDSIKSGITAFKERKDFGEGKFPVAIDPRLLLVPSRLAIDAEMFLNSPTLNTQANPGVPNPVRAKLTPVELKYLVSQTGYYFATDPLDWAGVQVNFLNGNRTPFLNPYGDGSMLGQSFEIVFDCGVKAVNHEALASNAGA